MLHHRSNIFGRPKIDRPLELEIDFPKRDKNNNFI